MNKGGIIMREIIILTILLFVKLLGVVIINIGLHYFSSYIPISYQGDILIWLGYLLLSLSFKLDINKKE